VEPLSLSVDQQLQLLALARASLARALSAGGAETAAPEPHRGLDRLAGAFVTLRARDGRLRGCIGQTRAMDPLAAVVARMAVAAGTRDPRFLPVTPTELDELVIEVSVLSAPEACTPEQVLVGRDGLVVRRGGRSGLLLPQVATEQGWSREEFLDATSRKAGLAPDAWRSDAELLRFEAVHFAEQR